MKSFFSQTLTVLYITNCTDVPLTLFLVCPVAQLAQDSGPQRTCYGDLMHVSLMTLVESTASLAAKESWGRGSRRDCARPSYAWSSVIGKMST